MSAVLWTAHTEFETCQCALAHIKALVWAGMLLRDFCPVQDFWEAYKDITFTKSPEKYFKYSVKDMQTLLIETFSR